MRARCGLSIRTTGCDAADQNELGRSLGHDGEGRGAWHGRKQRRIAKLLSVDEKAFAKRQCYEAGIGQ